MNKIVTLPKLISQMMEVSGHPKDVCENFVVAFMRTVCDALAAGDTAAVSGFGQFVCTPGVRGSVSFVPDKTFADDVNSPFEAFEPETLAPGVTPYMLGMAPVTPGKAVADSDGGTPPLFVDFLMKQP